MNENEEQKEDKLKLILTFAKGDKITIINYSTIDIMRNKNDYNVNITNAEKNFAFSNIYDEILKNMENDICFDVAIQSKANTITSTPMTAHYYNSGEHEVLSIIKYQEENSNETLE